MEIQVGNCAKLWDSTREKSLLVAVQEINRTLKTMKDIALGK